MEPELRLVVEDMVVKVEGELDIATAPALHACLALFSHADVTLDLSDLTFVDARGVGVVLHAALRLRDEGHDLRVKGVQPMARRVFELAGARALLTDIWPVAS